MKFRLFILVCLFWFVTAVGLASGQGWLPLVRVTSAPTPTFNTNFAAGTTSGICASITACFSVTNSGGRALNANGTLTSAFGSNTLRISTQGILVEGSSQNLHLYSQSNFNSQYTLSNVTVSDNAVASPDTTTTASTITDNSSNVGHNVGSNVAGATQITFNNGTFYVASLYAKAGTLGFVQVAVTTSVASGYVDCDLSGGTVSGTGGTFTTSGIQALGATGWYRCWMGFQSAFSGLGSVFAVMIPNGTATRGQAYAGSNQTIQIWGLQLEPNITTPTSYITTTTAAVTRNNDNVTFTGGAATLLASNTGTLAVATNQMPASAAGTLVDANGSILLGKTAGNAATTNLVAGLTTGNTATWTGALQSAIAWAPSARSIVLNNGTVATDSNSMTPASTFHLGSTSGSGAFDNGYTANLSGWNTKLADGFLGAIP